MRYATLFIGVGSSNFDEGVLWIGAIEADTQEAAAVRATTSLRPYYKLLGIAKEATGVTNGHGTPVSKIIAPRART